MTPIIHTFKTPENLSDSFVIQLITWINETPGEVFHLALSGGKTPSLLFSVLAEKYADKVPWKKIHFWWGDERMVAPSDRESNFGVVNQLLFSKIGVLKNQIHRIKGEEKPDQEVKRYSLEIESQISIINGWPKFDLIILGLGDDGHTASIFPGEMELLESEKITAIARHPETGQQRITLTGKVLNNSKRVAFLVTGTSKSRIFNKIISDSQESATYPAAHIRTEGETHWFIDEACSGMKN
jgi:6-phosphogluconolactonase